MSDWGEDASAGFAAAFGTATENNFNAKSTDISARDNTVFAFGRRVSPDWKNSIKVFVFVLVVFGGFVAIHVSRIVEGPVTDASSRSSSSNTTTESFSLSHFLDENARAFSVISLCATVPFFILSMGSMFLCVFVDPGRLPRMDQLDQKELATALLARESGGGGGHNTPQQQQQQRSPHHQHDLAQTDPSVFSDTSSHQGGGAPIQAASSTNSLSAGLLSSAAAGGGGDAAGAGEPPSSSSIRTFSGTQVPITTRGPTGQLVITGHLPPHHTAEAEFLAVNQVNIPTPFCTTCKIRRPVRASHCTFCGRCLLGFDHHCTLIGACCGHHNVRFFVGFIWTVGLLCWLCGICSILLTISVQNYADSRYFVGGIVYSVVTLVLALQLGCNLSCYYCFLTCKGFTYREWVKRDTLYGGSAFGKNPFAVSSCPRQFGYVCCPLDTTTVDPKDWAESDGKISTREAVEAPSPGASSASAGRKPGPVMSSSGLSLPTVSPAPQSKTNNTGLLGECERSPLVSPHKQLDYGSGVAPVARREEDDNDNDPLLGSPDASAETTNPLL